MDLERERGITIQMHPVTIYYSPPSPGNPPLPPSTGGAGGGVRGKGAGSERYELNLIDTPGHVDFSYEVSRSLAACEGAILLVDAFQGVQAQTVANSFLRLENNLVIVPVLNKIDMSPPGLMRSSPKWSTLGVVPADVLRAAPRLGWAWMPSCKRSSTACRRRRQPRGPASGPRLQQPF